MKSILIYGKIREKIGKSFNKKLRNTEQVPCILYHKNREKKNINFFTSITSFRELVYTPNSYIVTIEWEEKEKKTEAILKEVQFHPISNNILHADFSILDMTKSIVMQIPIKTIGRSIGESQGGFLRLMLRKLRIKALPNKIPDYFEIDITFLEKGDKISIKNIINNNYFFLHSKDTVILTIKS